MEELKQKTEGYNPCEVKLMPGLDGIDLKNAEELVYAVNPENFSIIIGKCDSNNGHYRIHNMYGSDASEGGYIYPKKVMMTFNGGLVFYVEDKVRVKKAIEKYLGLNLGIEKYEG